MTDGARSEEHEGGAQGHRMVLFALRKFQYRWGCHPIEVWIDVMLEACPCLAHVGLVCLGVKLSNRPRPEGSYGRAQFF